MDKYKKIKIGICVALVIYAVYLFVDIFLEFSNVRLEWLFFVLAATAVLVDALKFKSESNMEKYKSSKITAIIIYSVGGFILLMNILSLVL